MGNDCLLRYSVFRLESWGIINVGLLGCRWKECTGVMIRMGCGCWRSGLSRVLVGALVVGSLLGTVCPAHADEEWVETRVVDGQKVEVLTNSGVRQYKRKMQVKNNVLRNVTPMDITPPKPAAPAYNVSSSGYNGTWAFSTFDASKRMPRIVESYGLRRGSNGQAERAWMQVDLNDVILRQCRIWQVDPLLVEIVIRHESNFDPQVVSPAGAVGLMQLMPGTASGLGVSNLYDVEQNVAGGVHYLAIQLERFGSVPLALAAYNAGPAAVDEYGGVPPYSETQYYVDTIYGEYLAGKFQRERSRK